MVSEAVTTSSTVVLPLPTDLAVHQMPTTLSSTAALLATSLTVAVLDPATQARASSSDNADNADVAVTIHAALEQSETETASQSAAL